jgi:hypothetical protein
MRRAEHEVSVRYDSCVKILSDPVMMGMLSYPTSAPAARVLMARDDLDKIDRLLRPATGALATHVKTIEQDRQALYDNILQQGWAI